MKNLGYIILSTALIAGPVSAEEKTAAPSTLPATELTNTVNATATEPVQLAQETQAEPTQVQSQPMEKTEAAAPQEEQSGFNPGTVARSAFTSSIEDREPVDTLQQMNAMDQKVYFFTELRDMEGQTATHRWEFNGDVMAEVAFEVKGSRWRVWSSKNLQPEWAGEWKVSVLNGANEVISETSLNVTSATAGETAPAMDDETAPATSAPAESKI